MEHQRAILIKISDHSSIAEKTGHCREIILAVWDTL